MKQTVTCQNQLSIAYRNWMNFSHIDLLKCLELLRKRILIFHCMTKPCATDEAMRDYDSLKDWLAVALKEIKRVEGEGV